MRVAHFDCFSGISGDMTLGALVDAGVPGDAIRAGIASLGLPIKLTIEKVRKGGFAATQVRVQAPARFTRVKAFSRVTPKVLNSVSFVAPL